MQEKEKSFHREQFLVEISMIIKGLQKLSLIDYPDKLTCTIFTFGCNFRCGFCHNPELVKEDNTPEIKKSDVINFLKKRKKFLDAVCITGGEPTINKGLIDFISEIRSLGYLIKLDTNGTNPEMIEKLIDKKLVDYIAMDIKGPLKMYDEVVGVKVNIDDIKKSVDIIKSKMEKYEFRITVVPGLFRREHVKPIGEWLGKINIFYIQNFRNNKTLDKKFSNVNSFDIESLEDFQKLFKKYFKVCKIRN